MSKFCKSPFLGQKMVVGERNAKLVSVSCSGDGFWNFLCDCGALLRTRVSSVRSGSTTSCGCRSHECLDAGRDQTTHGLSKLPEYQIWAAMKRRCFNPHSADYVRYGGRGITVCDAWKGDFPAFFAAVGLRPSPAHSLDRDDVNGHYEPGNVCWATPKQQARNRRHQRVVSYAGRSMTLAEACEIAGVDYRRTHSRMQAGRSLGDALLPVAAKGDA